MNSKQHINLFLFTYNIILDVENLKELEKKTVCVIKQFSMFAQYKANTKNTFDFSTTAKIM